ncbi:hypothetical protein BH09PSE2_BH09PSE2_26110 [soil metagenome]
MKRVAVAGLGIMGALCVSATAHAQASPKLTDGLVTPVALQSLDQPSLGQPFSVPTPKKSLQLDSNGRWGLRLDMEKPAGRNMDWKDVEAGAYFKVTPRLRVGGAIGLGDRFSDATRITPAEAAAPRVHLETAFKF